MSAISADVQAVVDWVASFDMFRADPVVRVSDDGSRCYRYRAGCDCGWVSRPYAAVHAARDMAEDHRDFHHGGRAVVAPIAF